jgi:tetratricopeptide (TPR) repeat protein
MSVFAGGARLDAIESVCGPADDLGTDVLTGLEDLVDQSLVQGTDVRGEPRYTMLQTVHGYATERLAASGEIEVIRRRHAEAYLAIVERASPELIGSDQRTWLDLLEDEHDNVGAAIDWAVEANETELALRLVAAPWRFWQMRGHLIEARDRIARALEMPDADAHPTALARALGAAGGIAYWLGDHPASVSAYLRALAIARGLDDRPLLAQALTDAALSESDTVDPASLAVASERALGRLEEALSIYRELGDRRGEAGALWTIGTGYTYIGDLEAATRFQTQAAAVAIDSGDLFHASWATYMLAGLAGRMGDRERAAVHYREALAMFASVRDVTGMMLCLVEIANALSEAGDMADASRLASAATSFEMRHGGTYLATVRGLSERPDPKEAIGNDPILAAAWAEGEALSLDDAVAQALTFIDQGRWKMEP